jgi:hypothetical protein
MAYGTCASNTGNTVSNRRRADGTVQETETLKSARRHLHQHPNGISVGNMTDCRQIFCLEGNQ